jgi:hypothetical protein
LDSEWVGGEKGVHWWFLEKRRAVRCRGRTWLVGPGSQGKKRYRFGMVQGGPHYWAGMGCSGPNLLSFFLPLFYSFLFSYFFCNFCIKASNPKNLFLIFSNIQHYKIKQWRTWFHK